MNSTTAEELLLNKKSVYAAKSHLEMKVDVNSSLVIGGGTFAVVRVSWRADQQIRKTIAIDVHGTQAEAVRRVILHNVRRNLDVILT